MGTVRASGKQAALRRQLSAHASVTALLTANRAELARPSFVALARRLGLTASQLVFRFALDVGMMPLTGTSSSQHMKEDLAVLEAEPLEPRDVAAIEAISRA